MAYRRRQQHQGMAYQSPALEEEDDPDAAVAPPALDFGDDSSPSSSSSSLAAKAIRASSAYRDSSLSSAYAGHRVASQSATNSSGSRYSGLGSNPNPNPNPNPNSSSSSNSNSNPSPTSPYSSQPFSKDAKTYEYSSMKKLTEPKQGFWGSLARKAKSIIDDDNEPQQFDTPPGRTTTKAQIPSAATRGNVGLQHPGPDRTGESRRRTDNPTLQRGFNALTSSINYIGGTIGNALEEGISIVENRTADIIQETRKHIKKKTVSSETQNQAQNSQPQMQTDLELQLKASRDVAMAMAAKAKLLLRELKTVKADLAFAKERCAQLEEENKVLRENRERGDYPEDDDLIRLQLETLLAEKARLAHENSVYARENRFLREVVEYHQLTMQDVVYLDEGSEEVTEVYPIKVMASNPSPLPGVKGVSKGAT